ncbi:hypothetical protein ASE21_00125 [Flavobacterium sp. Root901]|uniref:response regulator n=1 Tax=Flavobacterium sp. Root901 TaxID=1736605 RepID=UPI00070E36F8|nr:response regulator [Flavobacterium sp. Root901]KRD12364.1 hypothetical protein ASE21_00125 [Flavobacterium sp. Root901]
MSSKRILLIDDDIDDVEIFVEAIHALDKEVQCQTELNPAKALEELSGSDKLPDVILIDYNMPMINGLEFLQRLKNIRQSAEIDVVVMSTPPKEVMIPWLHNNNAFVKYIAKPTSFEELKIALDSIL